MHITHIAISLWCSGNDREGVGRNQFQWGEPGWRFNSWCYTFVPLSLWIQDSSLTCFSQIGMLYILNVRIGKAEGLYPLTGNVTDSRHRDINQKQICGGACLEIVKLRTMWDIKYLLPQWLTCQWIQMSSSLRGKALQPIIVNALVLWEVIPVLFHISWNTCIL